MVLVRRLHKRNANIVVEANAEVLFAPTGEVSRWTNRFSRRIRDGAIAEAPVNKRPRWAHYGKPLKSTFTASTTYQPGRMRVYSAIGSSSPHAYYVDQGTGIYAGSGPYEAKVLPPWTRGDPSLYESTWSPGGPGQRRVGKVLIKGQKGQFFFASGLKRGFESMRLLSTEVPGEGGKIGDILDSIPTGMLGFLGNTVSDQAFVAQLTEWRTWRDTAWRARRGLGKNAAAFEKRRAKAKSDKVKAREQAKAKTRAAIIEEVVTNAPRKPSKAEQYIATQQAAERRKRAAIEEARKRNEAKALGEKRKLEKEQRERDALAKRKAARTFEKARLEAYKYMHAIEGAYPDAVVQISKDKTMIRVHFTGPDGAHNEYFLR